MFKVVVTEVSQGTDTPQQVVRYEQCVDALDLIAIIEAVNAKPRKVREPRAAKTK